MPLEGDLSQWQDSSGKCVLREERHNQPLPEFNNPKQASDFAVILRDTLAKNKTLGAKEVSSQLVEQGNKWVVLASFVQERSQATLRVWQLFLSDAGKLRIVTGTVPEGEGCALAMREYLRFSVR